MSEPFLPSTTKSIPVRDPSMGRRRVVAVAIPDSDPLELIGPLEVLNAAEVVLRQSGHSGYVGYDVEVVGPRTGPVYSFPGLELRATRSLADVDGEIDTLLVPAMDGREECLSDDDLIGPLKKMARMSRRVVSICTGGYVLAAAGLLDGRRATTHWAWCDDFQRRFPQVQVDHDPIFVRDDNVYTSAGGTSGLDLMLALVEEDLGRDIALLTAQFLVVFLKRPGGQAQFSVHLETQLAEREPIHQIQTWVAENVGADLSVEALAERAGMSPRNFARVFAREVGMTPGRFVEQTRLEAARRALESTTYPVSRIAKMCGYGTSEAMRRAFMRTLGVSPREYRGRFATTGNESLAASRV